MERNQTRFVESSDCEIKKLMENAATKYICY